MEMETDSAIVDGEYIQLSGWEADEVEETTPAEWGDAGEAEDDAPYQGSMDDLLVKECYRQAEY